MKKYIIVIALLVLSTSAFAAKRAPDYNKIDSKFDDGLEIEFLGSYVNRDDGNINVLFMVTSKFDTRLNASGNFLYDDKGGRFLLNSVRIAGYPLSEHNIIANVPVIVLFQYPSAYEPKLRSKFLRKISRASVIINDHELDLDGVQLQNWASCLERMKPLGFSPREWFVR